MKLGFAKKDVIGIVWLLVALWVAFAIDIFLPLEQLGLRPRSLTGLPGIVAMPFVHINLAHIISNTVPLIVLLALVAFGRNHTARTVALIVVIGGVLLWCFGRDANHVGASGLVFGLATFLVAGGYMANSASALIIAVLTLILYGSSILVGVLPLQGGVSWDGHLSGAVAGILVATVLRSATRR